MTAKNKRQKIFDFIKTNKQASAQEIANWYKVPTATIRFHLRVLVEEGRVRAVKTHRVHSLGKPRLIYQIEDPSKEDSYRLMLDRVIKTAENDPDLIELLFSELLNHFGPVEHAGSSLTIILLELIDNLRQFGYDARWEVRKNSPRLIFQACPYRNSTCRTNFYCELDRRLIASHTGRAVTLINSMAENNISNCSFEIS